MIAAVLFFITICSGCALISAFFKYRFEQSTAVVLFSLIAALYFFGLLDLLPIGTIVVLIVAGAALCAVIVRIVRNHAFREFRRLFFTPAFLIFTIAFLIILFANHGRLVSNRDDFSHWANTVKRMALLDRFATSPESYAQFPNYPPAMSLVQYYLQSVSKMLGNGFSEWLLYVAFELSVVMLLLPALSHLEWKKKAVFPATTLFFCTCCVPGVFYPDVYRTLMIDPFLGLAAGYAFSILLTTQERSALDRIGLALSCAVITLIKLPGIYFSVCITIAVALDAIMEAKTRNTHMLPGVTKGDFAEDANENRAAGFKVKTPRVHPYMTAIACGAVTLATSVSWNIWLNYDGAQKRFTESVDWALLCRTLTGQDVVGYRGAALAAFFKNIIIERQSIGTLGLLHVGLSWFTLFLCLIGIAVFVSIFLRRKCEYHSKQLFGTLGVLFGTCLLYVFGLAVSYLFVFNQTEAVQLASFSRYMNIPLVMILMALYRPIAEFVCDWKKKGIHIVIALLLVMLMFAPLKELTSFALRRSVAYSREVRAPYVTITEKLPEMIIDPDEKICIVTDGNRDLCIQLLNFCMAPVTVSDYSIDVLDVSNNDIYDDDFSAEDWERALNEDNFKYVLMIRFPSGFEKKYAEVFYEPDRITVGALFSVDATTGRLSYICNVGDESCP
ncbi:MAG: hypothetical protein ABFC73_00875 [Clostridiaceae bacterium]